VILHSLDGHSLSVKDTCGQGCLHICFLKDLREVLHLCGTAGGNDGDGNTSTNVVDQFNVKATVGAVLINSVQEDLPGAKLLTGLGQLQYVNITSFSTAFDGALIPRDSGTQN